MVVSKLVLESRTTAQYPCLASNFVKYLRVSEQMSYFIHRGCKVWSLQMGLLRSWGYKQKCNSPDSLQAYATDETQPVGSSSGLMTPSLPSCPILS